MAKHPKLFRPAKEKYVWGPLFTKPTEPQREVLNGARKVIMKTFEPHDENLLVSSHLAVKKILDVLATDRYRRLLEGGDKGINLRGSIGGGGPASKKYWAEYRRKKALSGRV